MIGLCHNCFSSNSDIVVRDGITLCVECIKRAGNTVIFEHNGIKEKIKLCESCNHVNCRCKDTK